LQKIPYMLILGEKEASSGSASLRLRSGGDQGSMPVEEIINRAQELIRTRALTL
jgi:threonyl-tRNA synthetase